ncbi:MAG: hypothetical protein AB1938_20465 [Myxococcota bacterium]
MNSLLARSCLLLLTSLAGCGAVSVQPDGAIPPDAGSPDAGSLDAGRLADGGFDDGGFIDGGLLEVDWRQTRGAPLTVRVVGEHSGRPWALGDTRYAIETGCDASVCDYEWRDDQGALVASRRGLRAIHTSAISPDGRLASLLAPAEAGSCQDAQGFTLDWLRGQWLVLDVATGETLHEAPYQTTETIGPAFSAYGSAARLYPVSVGACASADAARQTRPPFGPLPALLALGPSAALEDDLSDGRLLVRTPPESVALVSANGDVVEPISSAATTSLVSGRWVHTFERQFVRSITSYDADARRAVQTSIPISEADFQVERVSHRLASVCGLPDAQARRCLIIDGAGEWPRADVRVARSAGQSGLRLAGREGFAVVVTETGGVVRLTLSTGAVEDLGLPAGELHAAGDGRAVLLTTADAALAIERDRVVRFPGRLLAVLSPELLGARPDLPQGPLVFVVTSTEAGGEAWLTAYNAQTRRLARLTDALYFSPPFGKPFTAAESCGVPGLARAAGAPAESLGQQAGLLHFTEFVAAATPSLRLFVMPVDLSAPPRLVAELPPDACAPPLASRSSRRLWLPVPTPTGVTRAVLGDLAE